MQLRKLFANHFLLNDYTESPLEFKYHYRTPLPFYSMTTKLQPSWLGKGKMLKLISYDSNVVNNDDLVTSSGHDNSTISLLLKVMIEFVLTWLNIGYCRWASIKLGLNMPARVEKTIRRNDCEFQLIGEPTGEYYDVVMFFGIIDILQDYDISKKLEHVYKSIQYDPTSISAVDPRQYSKRFRDFIFNIFTDDT